ncbi:MAG TPA: dihydrofolate reductase family protein [Candidatus Limnocylindrales bacterium]|nr:dihydrofolate reductase family protein [Candidatus Limnocylindrales bacterium]
MRKIAAGLFISLDGVVEAPEQWHFPYFDDEMGAIVGAQQAESDTMLLGRRTYEEFAAYWPNSDDELAAVMNGTPKLVASTTLTEPTWENTTVIGGDVSARLAELKRAPGRTISIVGSGTLVRSLLRDGLVDELRLLVHPIVVGAGKRLFPDGTDRVPLRLLDSRTLSTGVLALTYGPASD